MLKLTHIEDYLELIAGYRDVKTGALDTSTINYMLGIVESPISLARYDISVITNMVQGVSNNMGLTAKQAQLACKILLKYERQWRKLGVDVTPVQDPVFRIALRKMDYSCKLELSESQDQLLIKFPFNTDRVTEIREFSKNSQGAVRWNRDVRVWQSALTEYNINWLVTWATAYNFDVDSAVVVLYQKILDAEHAETPMELRLSESDQSLYITQAPDSLLDYLSNQHICLHTDHLLAVLDKCAELGITVSGAVQTLSRQLYPDVSVTQWHLCTSRETKTLDLTHLSEILDYADRLHRWPVVIHETDSTKRLWQSLLTHRGSQTEYIAHLQDAPGSVTANTRYIYTTKPVTDMPAIPLLVNGSGMNFNGDRMLMIQNSEKIVYTAQEVYKKAGHNHNTEVHFLAS